MRIVVLLHNIRSAHNVGSIFRTADGAGVEKIYLCGVTPAPLDRFGRYRADTAKVALGAERTMPWEHVRATVPLLRKLKRDGWTIAAVEQSPRAIPYYSFNSSTKVRSSFSRGVKSARGKRKVAVVLGAEVRGLPPSALQRADVILEVPMHGTKESLNVSVAAGIVLFAIRSR